MNEFKRTFPLEGKTIIVTRAQEQQNEAKKSLQNLGALVLDLPALHIGPPDNWDALDKSLDDLNQFDWIIFSSANGVRFVEERLRIKNLSISNLPSHLKIAAVGRKTANYLKDVGANVDFVPPKFVADSLIEYFPEPKEGLKILLPRVQTGGRPVLGATFEKDGASVVEVSAYESRCPTSMPMNTFKALLNEEVDLLAFTSGKTVSHTCQLMTQYFGDKWIDKLLGVSIISIGPQTSLTCMRYLKRVDQEANPHDLEGLVKACIKEVKGM